MKAWISIAILAWVALAQPRTTCWQRFELCEVTRDHAPFWQSMTGPQGSVRVTAIQYDGTPIGTSLAPGTALALYLIDLDRDGDVDLRDFAMIHGPSPDCDSRLASAQAEIVRLEAEIEGMRAAFVRGATGMGLED